MELSFRSGTTNQELSCQAVAGVTQGARWPFLPEVSEAASDPRDTGLTAASEAGSSVQRGWALAGGSLGTLQGGKEASVVKLTGHGREAGGEEGEQQGDG